MPTLREFVRSLQRRAGIDAAVVAGRDGLLIDGAGASALDAETLAVRVPQLLASIRDLGTAAARGHVQMAVIEYSGGTAVIQALSAEVVLLVLVHSTGNLAALLHDLRRFRPHLTAIA